MADPNDAILGIFTGLPSTVATFPSMTSTPLSSNATYSNPDDVSTIISGAQSAATQAYNQARLNLASEQLAFQKAQQAFTDYMSMAQQYGYLPQAPGGNYFQWPPSPTQPITFAGYHADSSGSFYPSTGMAGVPTMAQQQMLYQMLQGQAQAAAGQTGIYQQPIPGEWLQHQPSWDQIEAYMAQINPDWDHAAAKDAVTKLVNETPETFHGNYPLAQLSLSDIMMVIERYGGMPKQPTLQLQGLYGGYGTPTAGQQTLAAQAQAASIAAKQAELLGTYTPPGMYAPGSYVQDPSTGAYYQAQSNGALQPISALPQGATAIQGPAGVGATSGQAGQTTLQAQNQYFQQALQQAQLNQKSVQDYLNLVATLRGPQDYGQYLKVMASTPQGLQSLTGAAAAAGGRVPAFGYTGAPTNPVTAAGLAGAAAGGQAPGGQAAGNTSYDQYFQAVQGLPAPSQIAPQNWNAMTDVQKQLLLGMYEQAGWNVNDVMNQYKASLPRFGTTTAQVGQTRLV